MNLIVFFTNSLFIRVKKSITTMGLLDEQVQLGKIFPNPSRDVVNIPLNINESGNVNIKFFNIYGQLVLEKSDYFNIGNHMVLLPNDLPAGQYTVTVDQESKHLGNQAIVIIK